jgi:hypothetical protein
MFPRIRVARKWTLCQGQAFAPPRCAVGSFARLGPFLSLSCTNTFIVRWLTGPDKLISFGTSTVRTTLPTSRLHPPLGFHAPVLKGWEVWSVARIRVELVSCHNGKESLTLSYGAESSPRPLSTREIHKRAQK